MDLIKIIKYFGILFYILISKPLFNEIYATSKNVIDEEFHIRQGLHYCEGNFTVVNKF